VKRKGIGRTEGGKVKIENGVAEGIEGQRRATSSRMGIVGTHPAVFVRVANTGVTGYGTWKSV
jgi:hypothetical protein